MWFWHLINFFHMILTYHSFIFTGKSAHDSFIFTWFWPVIHLFWFWDMIFFPHDSDIALIYFHVQICTRFIYFDMILAHDSFIFYIILKYESLIFKWFLNTIHLFSCDFYIWFIYFHMWFCHTNHLFSLSEYSLNIAHVTVIILSDVRNFCIKSFLHMHKSALNTT